METNHRATVIIPCYNVEDYIQECLDSVLQQGDAVHHTFVVNNNCTDSTISRVQEWHKSHPTFRLTVSEEKKPGAPAARNNPLSQIETKWIQFLDADDLLVEGKISDQIQKFPQADVICAASKHLAIDGKEQVSLPEPNIPLALMKGQAGITSSNLFSTAAIRSVRGWDETLKSSQEYDLMFRLWKSGANFVSDFTPRAIIRERLSGQISQRSPLHKWIQFIELRLRMMEAFKFLQLDDDVVINLKQSLFDRIRTLAKYDLEVALRLYHQIPEIKGFTPSENELNTKSYVYLYKLLGFRRTEQLRHFLLSIGTLAK